jgi:hypothetical protein
MQQLLPLMLQLGIRAEKEIQEGEGQDFIQHVRGWMEARGLEVSETGLSFICGFVVGHSQAFDLAEESFGVLSEVLGE